MCKVQASVPCTERRGSSSQGHALVKTTREPQVDCAASFLASSEGESGVPVALTRGVSVTDCSPERPFRGGMDGSDGGDEEEVGASASDSSCRDDGV